MKLSRKDDIIRDFLNTDEVKLDPVTRVNMISFTYELDRSIFKALHPRGDFNPILTELSRLSDKYNDPVLTQLHSRIKKLFGYTAQLSFSYSSFIKDKLEPEDIQITESKEVKVEIVIASGDQVKLSALYKILHDDYELRSSIEEFFNLSVNPEPFLYFFTPKYIAYHICYRLCQLFSIPESEMRFKYMNSLDVCRVADKRSKSNHQFHVAHSPKPKEIVTKFDQDFIKIFPEFADKFRIIKQFNS